MRETREHVIFFRPSAHSVLFYTFKIARTVSAKMFTHQKKILATNTECERTLTYIHTDTETRSLARTYSESPNYG